MLQLKKLIRFDTNYVLKSGSWLMFGYVFTVLSILATSYVFANYLSPTVYGEYKYLLTIGVLLTSLSLTGLTAAVTQGTAKKIPGFFTCATKLGLRYELSITLLALLGSGYYFINNDTGLALGFLAIAIFQPLFNNSNLIFSYLQGKEAFQASTFAHIFKMTITGIAIVLSALFFEDPLLLLLTYLISNILVNYAVRYFAGVPTANDGNLDSKEVARLIRYAKHTSMRNIFTNIANQADKIIIFQNLTAADLAIYSFAIALPEQFKSITKSINTLLLPRFARHAPKNVRGQMLYKTAIYSLFLLVLVTLYILIAPTIFRFLFPDYLESVYLSQLFSLTTFFAIAGLPTSALQSQMSNQNLYKLEVTVSIAQTLFVLVFFTLFGLIGVIWARILGRAVNTALAFWLFYKLY